MHCIVNYLRLATKMVLSGSGGGRLESGIHPLRFDIIARMAAAHQALVGYSGSKWTDWDGKWFIINFNEKIMKEGSNRNGMLAGPSLKSWQHRKNF